MQYETLTSKDGNPILKINGVSIYSRYRPLEDARKFIYQEANTSSNQYFLLGLGYGYHLKALQEIVGSKEVQIIVYILDQYELTLFRDSPFYDEIMDDKRIVINFRFEELLISEDTQLILPQAWINGLPNEHPLYLTLASIKMKQRSFNENKEIMADNFSSNVEAKDFGLLQYKQFLDTTKIACLVASGPSLENTVSYLSKQREKLYILCVGSALKVLLKSNIIPDAIIIIDSNKITMKQFEGIEYSGPLFYLSTAYKETSRMLQGKRYMLLQKGYSAAESLAKKLNFPLLETGGSVATTGVSLLELLDFKQIVLFGQDLGFKGNQTHASGSTSGQIYTETNNLLTIRANSGEDIFTEKGFYSFLKWFEYKVNNTTLKLYNTALNGAEIKGIPFISEKRFNELVEDHK